MNVKYIKPITIAIVGLGISIFGLIPLNAQAQTYPYNYSHGSSYDPYYSAYSYTYPPYSYPYIPTIYGQTYEQIHPIYNLGYYYIQASYPYYYNQSQYINYHNRPHYYVPQYTTPPLSITCRANVTTSYVGHYITWTAYVSDGTGQYSFNWSGEQIPDHNNSSISVAYSTVGTKSPRVTVYSDGYRVVRDCEPIIILNTAAFYNNPW